jgi:type I restriction enzyme S subunit
MSKYERIALSALVSEYSERNRSLACTDVYSVTNSAGFVPSADYFSKEVFSKNLSTYKTVHRGMFAYNPSRVNVGSLAWLHSCDTVVVSPLYVVFKVDEDKVLQPYLDYFMHSDWGNSQIRGLTSGSVRDSLKFSALGEIVIPLPPLDTQRRITAALDKAQSLIAARREQIAVLDKLAKDLFIEMFGDPMTNDKGWNVVKLSTLGEFKNGMNYAQNDRGYTVKCLGVGDFGDLFEIEVAAFSDIHLTEKPSDNYILQDEDIVFVRSNGSRELVGRSVLIRTNGKTATFSGFCIRYRNKSECVLPVYLNTLLHMEATKNALFSTTRGANIQNLNQQMLSALDVLLPPIEEQQDYADRVSAINHQKSRLTASLAELETLYKSLTQRAFAGELFAE